MGLIGSLLWSVGHTVHSLLCALGLGFGHWPWH